MLPNIVIKYYSGEPVPAPYSVETHHHAHWEIVYYKTGTGISKILNDELYYTPNSYVIIPPFTPHSEESFTDGNFIFCLGFEMQTSNFQLPPNILFLDTENKELLSLLEKISMEVSEMKEYYKDVISSSIAEMLVRATRSISHSNKALIDERVELIKEYIKNYYNKQINFRNLSKSFFYSLDYMRHIFKEKTGMSLKQYVLTQRIEAAKQFLSTGDSVKAIASKCGFCSASHFGLVFLKFTGQTPSEYKNASTEIKSNSHAATILEEDKNSEIKRTD